MTKKPTTKVEIQIEDLTLKVWARDEDGGNNNYWEITLPNKEVLKETVEGMDKILREGGAEIKTIEKVDKTPKINGIS